MRLATLATTRCSASDPDAANEFCIDECLRAALDNGRSQAEAEHIYPFTQAISALDEYADYQECYYDRYAMNKPGVYHPDQLCPAGPPVISCLGSGLAPTPPGETAVFTNPYALTYWRETKENGSWGNFTEVVVPSSSDCGYEVDPSWYAGLGLSNDEMCVQWCLDVIEQADPSDYDDQQINHHNCATFYSGSLCYAAGMPPVVGPVSKALTLAAVLETTSGYVGTLFHLGALLRR